MTKIPFTVSARAARLIGRENVATSQGAITELVKNAYDADAKVCAILFVPSPRKIAPTLTQRGFEQLKSVLPEAEDFYRSDDAEYVVRGDLTEVEADRLASSFGRIPELWIVDNGHGMDAQTIADRWMVIGTDDKEYNAVSDAGRVMTGAKGIGRFALDRLGGECEMFSAPDGSPTIAHWIVDWGQFEGRGKVITDVEAILETETTSLSTVYNAARIQSILPTHLPGINEEICSPVSFERGTAIRLTRLHDHWDERETIRLKSTLEALLPPRDQGDFSIYVYDFRAEAESGFIDNFPPDQFDYRLHAVVHPNGKVDITLDRQEIDVSKITPTLFGLAPMQQPGFYREDFERGNFRYETNLRNILRLPERYSLDPYLAIGPLDFTLYFFKLANPTRKTLLRYPQKRFDPRKRQAWLRTSGGIRLYRDEFRVRPYGEPNTQGSDWLLLGQRVAANPAPASRRGWRVPPQQLAGTIHITKERNPLLADQSNREGIMNERAFAAFREIIIGLIGTFERDRAYIYGQFDKAYDLDNPEEKDREEGTRVAEEVLSGAEATGVSTTENSAEGESSKKSEDRTVVVAKALVSATRENEALRDDIQVLRGMATLGTVLVSFTHELKQIKANMHARRSRMEIALKAVADDEKLAKVPEPINPYNILDRWSREDEKVSRWVDFALSAVSTAKRRRKPISLDAYFKGLGDNWDDFLETKSATLSVESTGSAIVLAHEIDLDSIFYNLIINSVEAFVRPTDHTERDIRIIVHPGAEETVTIEYRDSGPGLAASLRSADEIFEFGVSSKPEDDAGIPTGTGIGMWLLQTIIQDYGGSVELRSAVGEPGFLLAMTLPLYKGREERT